MPVTAAIDGNRMDSNGQSTSSREGRRRSYNFFSSHVIPPWHVTFLPSYLQTFFHSTTIPKHAQCTKSAHLQFIMFFIKVPVSRYSTPCSAHSKNSLCIIVYYYTSLPHSAECIDGRCRKKLPSKCSRLPMLAYPVNEDKYGDHSHYVVQPNHDPPPLSSSPIYPLFLLLFNKHHITDGYKHLRFPTRHDWWC